MRTSTPFVILSAQCADLSDDINLWRTASMRRQLHNSALLGPVLPVLGKYNGIEERSFLVFLPGGNEHRAAFDELLRIAARWQQESILYVDANRYASLYYPHADGMIHTACHLGRWIEVSKGVASDLEAFTETEDGRIWAVV